MTKAPINAPITVPDPPVSAVPPMTAAAMASRVRLLPPASGAAEPETVAVIKPVNAARSTQDHEGGDLYAVGAHADLASGQQVAAGGDHMQAKDGAGKDERQDQHDDHCPDDRREAGETVPREERIERTESILTEDQVEGLLHRHPDGLTVRERDRDASQQKEHAERGNQRWDAQLDGDESVDEPDADAEQDGNRRRHPERPPQSVAHAESSGTGPWRRSRRRTRSISAGDHHQDDTDGDHPNPGRVAQHHAHQGAGQEDAVVELDIDDEQDRDGGDARFPVTGNEREGSLEPLPALAPASPPDSQMRSPVPSSLLLLTDRESFSILDGTRDGSDASCYR